MAGSFTSITPHNTVGVPVRAGSKLRRIRERLNLTLRAVEEATLEIAAAENNSEFVVSVARLNQIENDGSLPSIYKLYSLAVVLQLKLEEIAALYAIDVGKMDEHRSKMPHTRTHMLSLAGGDPNRPIRFPIRFDSGFRPEKTIFISRLIEAWGEIPVSLLAHLNLKKHRYGYIGLEDRMMVPLLRPGSIVQIDDSRRRVVNQGWATEADRPIYFLELRYSYECCWCFQRGHDLTLVPHPLSPCGPRTVRIPDEGDVLGQVVGVAMRLVQQGP
jgi:transcriptional regulator with XRE-family HTH domain